MCDFCEPNGRERAFNRAKEFDRMAILYREIGAGRIKPHDDTAKPVAALASNLLRELVGWV